MEVDFSDLKYGVDEAYIMYADSAWAAQYWGTPAEGVTATEAEITGFGDYTVGLEFATEAQGLAFAALGLKKGEITYPALISRSTPSASTANLLRSTRAIPPLTTASRPA